MAGVGLLQRSAPDTIKAFGVSFDSGDGERVAHQ